MAPRSRCSDSVVPISELKYRFLLEKFVRLNDSTLSRGASVDQLRKCVKTGLAPDQTESSDRTVLHLLSLLFVILAVFVTFHGPPYLDGAIKTAFGVKCVVPNNYFVWEATRPVADCSICSNSSLLVLRDVSRETFAPYAYSYRPILVKGAALHWPALKHFSFDFFKRLFEKYPEAYESVEEECQFLNFKSNFTSLREALEANSSHNWYIGWSNCHAQVIREMRQYYSTPHFLPEDAEHSHVDFVFMGYERGAYMHLDYISRLMWQAQILGHKTWRLNPAPECEAVCPGLEFTVEPGDIFLLDTRQWYHDTRVSDSEFSLTVSSEYG